MYKTQNRKFQQLEIGLTSPKEIRSWAERFLPNGDIVGEVTSWETVNYKTLKPEPNGLFCQKIFGPIVDYTCACGKKSVKVSSDFCSKCGVERTTSRVRRYRMGYIKLNQPLAHTLYASQKPSPLALSLNWSNKRLQAVLYGTEFCHLPEKFEYFCSATSLDSKWSTEFQKELKIHTLSNLKNSQSEKLLSNLFIADREDRKKNTPRLFKTLQKNKPTPSNLKNSQVFIEQFYSKQKLRVGLHLYGVGYDMTWRQVEDVQDFLMYSWEQPQLDDTFLPFYKFTYLVSDASKKETPHHVQYYPIQTGAYVFQKILAHYDLVGLQQHLTLQLEEVKLLISDLKEKIEKVDWSQRKNVQLEITRLKQLEKKRLRRVQYFRDFYISKMQPSWMMLSYLPVLPPGLRPITSIRGELVVSDLNSLYRKILTRNRRLTNSTRFSIFDTALSGSWASWCYNFRQVQEALDSLLKTGKVESGKTTKSLLDALKGKRGRFRQHLLGKRVDYSGRSVIVVGPELKIYECGLPKQMAVELFQPFLIQQLRNKGIAFTTTGAKAIIVERKPIIWSLLREIMRNHPVLLNRAPTLHRLGIQAFIPKLVNGKAILLHPLVCPAFNADFDGDQMAVHVPLSPAAKAEAFNLLLACNHMLAPSSGQPLLLPTQDMILGCYYLTIAKENQIQKHFDQSFASISVNEVEDKSQNLKNSTKKSIYFSDFYEVLESYTKKYLNLHTPVWVRWSGLVQNFVSEIQSREREQPCEIRIDTFGNTETLSLELYQRTTSPRGESLKPVNMLQKEQIAIRKTSDVSFIRTTPGRILLYKLFLDAQNVEVNS
jgi:DNA-directed RNA polymerase subunit beta'